MIGTNTLARFAAPVVNALVARQGRRHGLSRPTSRRAFIGKMAGRDALEIGPFDRPLLCGPGVRYFDVLDTELLKKRAADLGRSPQGVPPIDYHSPIGNLSIVNRTFDAVLSCHAIEHQPDLIAHLNSVASLLKPGGRYYVVVPDKRFSFDHFQTLSTADDVLAANRSRRSVHRREDVIAHHLNTTHNNPLRHWLGLHGHPGIAVDAETRVRAEKEAEAADRGDYVDVHAWLLSPRRFLDLVTGLKTAGLVNLDVVEVHETGFAELEFFAVLQKSVTNG